MSASAATRVATTNGSLNLVILSLLEGLPFPIQADGGVKRPMGSEVGQFEDE
jgi:hypothetical protein